MAGEIVKAAPTRLGPTHRKHEFFSQPKINVNLDKQSTFSDLYCNLWKDNRGMFTWRAKEGNFHFYPFGWRS